MAGVLAMHALSTGHSSHVAMATGTQHGDAHVHSGDHHQNDSAQTTQTSRTSQLDRVQSTEGADDVDASAAAELSVSPSDAQAGVAVVPGTAGQRAVQGPEIAGAVLADTRGEHTEQVTGHELCLDWVPGHCPAVPMGTPMCQAVLTGAGVVLLLLMLSMLAMGTRRTMWVLALHPVPTSSGPGRWRTWQYRLPIQGPSLQELCISRT